jgi:thiol-disulfide isomerase/thioredoxin
MSAYHKDVWWRVQWRGVFKEVLIFLILAFVVSNVMSYLRRPQLDSNTLPSLSAPPLKGSRLGQGGEHLTDEQIKGEPFVLYFWGSWCSACTAQSPVIEALSREGVKVLTVAVDSGSDGQLTSLMAEKGYTFPTLNDQSRAAQRHFKVSAFPTTFIYNSKGTLSFSEVGYTSRWGLKARLALAR